MFINYIQKFYNNTTLLLEEYNIWREIFIFNFFSFFMSSLSQSQDFTLSCEVDSAKVIYDLLSSLYKCL